MLTDITFENLFDIDHIQEIQDSFALSTNVASIITDPAGIPITRPSNFCRLCMEIIRETPLGLSNCIKSDSIIGKPAAGGPIIQPCLSGGLWDAGVSIMVGDKHVANWLIGQVRNEAQDNTEMIKYAQKIGANENDFLEALNEVSVMSHEQFKHVANSLFLIARQISELALKNLQKSEVISKLESSERKYRELFEKSKDAVLILENNVFVDCNQATVDMLRYKNKAELLQVHPSALSPDTQPDGKGSLIKANEMIAIAIDKGSHRFEWNHVRADGEVFPVEVLLTAITVNDDIQALHTVWRDITDRKEVEDSLHTYIKLIEEYAEEQTSADIKIRASLEEKEVLLKEIHHRVKNNMAVISSLLALQSGHVDDKKYINMFTESQSRIRSMALVHEKLYQSDDFSHINIREYLATLSQSVKTTFAGDADISINVELDDLQMDIDMLIPCGLIINEFLTNSFKYAFNDHLSPEINISLNMRDDNNIQLILADNGKGFPDGFDLDEAKGLGLKLVTVLVEQINGNLDVRSEEGVAFIITLPSQV